MRYSDLSESVRVSTICFGCEPLGGKDWGNVNIADIDLAVHRSIELGVNYFDTADVYGLGQSEERLSRILGTRRHELVIATKGGVSWRKAKNLRRAKTSLDSSPKYLRKAVENSLRRLRLDCLPVYYVHRPDPNTDIRITFEFLAKLQSEDKIRLLGCSNYNSKQIVLASEVVNLSVVQLPINILTGSLPVDLLDICNKHNVKIIAYNVLASGLLTGKYDEDSKFDANDRRSRLPLFQGKEFRESLKQAHSIEKTAQNSSLTVCQYSINWVLNQPRVASAIIGIKNVKQLEEDILGVSG